MCSNLLTWDSVNYTRLHHPFILPVCWFWTVNTWRAGTKSFQLPLCTISYFEKSLRTVIRVNPKVNSLILKVIILTKNRFPTFYFTSTVHISPLYFKKIYTSWILKKCLSCVNLRTTLKPLGNKKISDLSFINSCEENKLKFKQCSTERGCGVSQIWVWIRAMICPFCDSLGLLPVQQ